MILVVRRTYRREAVVGQYWIYQINAISAKVSLCPKRFCSDVFVCVSYLAGRESWRLQLLLLPGSVLSEEGIQEDARCGQHHRIGDWVTPGHFTMAVLCCGNHRPPWAAGFTLDGFTGKTGNLRAMIRPLQEARGRRKASCLQLQCHVIFFSYSTPCRMHIVSSCLFIITDF